MPITDKWKELLPINMQKQQKESTNADRISEGATELVRAATTTI